MSVLRQLVDQRAAYARQAVIRHRLMTFAGVVKLGLGLTVAFTLFFFWDQVMAFLQTMN